MKVGDMSNVDEKGMLNDTLQKRTAVGNPVPVRSNMADS